MSFPRLNGRKGGEIVQLVLDHGKLKPSDIYHLLREPTPNLCESPALLRLLLVTEPL